MSLTDIEKELEHKSDKSVYLNEQLKKHPHLKQEIRKLLIDAVKEKNLVKTSVQKRDIHYTIIYDSIGEGLEPIYFWFLDFMREKYTGLGLDVSKTSDDYEASITSTFFGEMGARGSRMQEQAMRMMQTINTIIRSIINLIYDLKEFEIRLDSYKQYHSKNRDESESALLGLKQLWMDQVDIKRGRGSLNMMAQQLQFVTLRDAFMAANSVRSADKLDLNDRVKRILKPRIQEFFDWVGRSEKELQKRYNIEKSYLRSQLSSLKLYASWAKPYLKMAQQLNMKDFRSPDVVSAFNTMVMELSLFGKQSVGKTLNKEYFACIEVNIRFRAIPQSIRTQQGMQFVNSGRARIDIKAYSLSDQDLEVLKEQELYEGLDLIEEMIGTPLTEIREDIEHYLKEEDEEKKKEKRGELDVTMPFRELGKGFKEIARPFKYLFKFRKAVSEPFSGRELRKKAASEARSKASIMYEVYKKSHGMLNI